MSRSGLACRRCGGTGKVAPRMSEEMLAAYAAIGGCLDRVPCECAMAGHLTVVDDHAGHLTVVDVGRLSESK